MRRGWQLGFLFVVLSLGTLVHFAGCTKTSKTVSEIKIETEVTPQPVRVGEATVTFKLRDSSGGPVTGSRAILEANMTHPGMSPVFADAKEISPGTYQAPIALSMAGDWDVLIHISLADGQKLEQLVKIRGVRSD